MLNRKHIGIIGSEENRHVLQLKELLEKKGHVCHVYSAAETVSEIGMPDGKPVPEMRIPGGKTLSGTEKSIAEPAAVNQLLFADPSHKFPLANCDAVLIRGIPSGTAEQIVYRMNALASLENTGLLFVNSPKAVEITVDKYLTSQLLAQNGIQVPPTIVCEGADAAQSAFHQLGGDVIYKPLFGSCGRGMRRFTSEAALLAALPDLTAAGRVIYLQKFIPCGNCDLRFFVIDGCIAASMKRIGTDWRSNCTLGGTALPFSPTPELSDLAIRSAAVTGARVTGVDILPAGDGSFYVTEVNGCPGWQALRTVSSVNIPELILKTVL